MRLTTESFRGESPRVTPRALPENAAQAAVNAYLMRGDAGAWRQFSLTKALATAAPVRSIALINDAWMSWQEEVDVARGIIPGDTTYRTYITGLDVPRFTNYAMATTGPEPFPVTTRPLGVPNPSTAPTVEAGIDPNPTTFTIDVLDEGDKLSTDWTTNPPLTDSTKALVVQDNVSGNPAPSYRCDFDENRNPGQEAYAYRDFGVGGVNLLSVTADVLMTNRSQFCLNVANTPQGYGLRVWFNDGSLTIAKATGWGCIFNRADLTTVACGLALNVWYDVRVTVTLNEDNTKKVTAAVYNPVSLGGALIAQVSATSTFDDGNMVGIANGINDDAPSVYITLYDNIHVQATGSTSYVPVNTATSYLYTFVNDLGEESGPSFPSATILRPDGVAITVTTPTEVPTGVSLDYGITAKRIYRAATGATGTDFFFVDEIPLSQADYVDTTPDTELGDALESDEWELPPDDLRGILALPNGVMVGFRRNQLCLSAQNRPHAWPVRYRLNTDTDIVGIGNIDTTVLIGTESFPYVASGNDPAAYSMAKFEVPQACVAKRSVAYLTGIGVVFASPDGLVAVSGVGQVRNLTEGIFTRAQWQALAPTSIIAIAHDDVYFAFYDTGSEAGGFALDMSQTGFGLISLAFHATAAYADPLTDNLYLVLDADDEPADADLPLPSTAPTPNGNTIYQFDGAPTDHMVYRWRSKLYITPVPMTFERVQVKAATYDNTLFRFYKQVLNETSNEWEDVLLREVVVANSKPFNLPMSSDYQRCWWEVLSTDTIESVQVGQDVSELE